MRKSILNETVASDVANFKTVLRSLHALKRSPGRFYPYFIIVSSVANEFLATAEVREKLDNEPSVLHNSAPCMISVMSATNCIASA